MPGRRLHFKGRNERSDLRVKAFFNVLQVTQEFFSLTLEAK